MLSENEHDLQKALDIIYNCSMQSCLHVSTDTIKMDIFSRGKVKNILTSDLVTI